MGKLQNRSENDVAKKDQLGGALGKYKRVHELLADVVEATENLDILGALKEASPWAEAFGNALGDALPPVRFLLKLFEAGTKVDDPSELGYLAATLAYHRAVEQAWLAMPVEARERLADADPQLRKKTLAELRAASPPESYDFSRFSFDRALDCDFFRDAERFLAMSTQGLGLNEASFPKLQHGVRIRFVTNLKGILSHGSTRERFAPFRELMALETIEARAYNALLEHADYQRWLFEEQKVLGSEPFTLAQIYTETDCGLLRWADCTKKGQRDEGGERVDPFNKKHGGRQPLIETVLDLIADPKFKDAIVIQGVAGSGKSSATLRLAWELVRQGLRPIRVELKHLDASDSASLDEALPDAVHITSADRDLDATSLNFGKELFLGGAIFKEDVLFRGTRICPYVLILDGWDEITVGASEGYQQRVERMLLAVRRKFLEQRAFPIRVILAGRPTHAIEESKFLRDESRLLTVRDLSPPQLEGFVESVKSATAPENSSSSSWSLAKVTALPEMLERYREAHEAAKENETARIGSLEILGLPLLALLALRLLAARPDDSEGLLANTTNLYRSLVDLVVGQAAKPEGAAVKGSAMISGRSLRELLRGTAEAMTALGAETIPHDELLVRLDLDEAALDFQVEELAKEALSRLMISFFFRGGRTELGVEFSHKSFREYLFAEQVVAVLKTYGHKAPASLPARQEGWRDFEDGDPRKALCHRLAELLGPTWVTNEVALHLRQLLAWEIRNSAGSALASWIRIRDGLADAWDWWAEGVHQRSQPTRKDGQWEYAAKPLALEIAERMRFRSERRSRPVPPQITEVDAHLGDGIFRLVATMHAEVALREGWRIEGSKTSDWEWVDTKGPRRYQAAGSFGESRLLIFAPRASKLDGFLEHCARINAGGFRPMGHFPAWADLRCAVLSSAILSGENFGGADLRGAFLFDADLRGAFLGGADLSGTDLSDTDFRGAFLGRADLGRADLSDTDFRCAILSAADLRDADLRRSDLRGADLTEADLRGADLRGAYLRGADLRGADLRGADLRGADYDPEQLKTAILE